MDDERFEVRRGPELERHDPEVDGPYWTAGRIGLTALVLSIVLFWAWAFSGLVNFPWAPSEVNVDEMGDQVLVTRADAACEVAQDRIDVLPRANTVGSPAERADLVVLGNEIIVELLRELRTLTADNADDQFSYDEWLDDWDIYLSDRERHVERLRTEGDVRFRLTDVGTQHLTNGIDGFARVNDMDNCEVPRDL
ncbi:MAG: hypothetical protein HKN26_16025 [Acidimicrobiales bacterium]|nr:hypothetical protein [Acidimicrobiales bacterium]